MCRNVSKGTPTRTKRTPKKWMVGRLWPWKTSLSNIRPLGSKIQPFFFGESVFLLALGAGKELLSLRVLVHRYFAQLFFGGIFVAGAVAASHGGEREVMMQKHRTDYLDILHVSMILSRIKDDESEHEA